MLESWSSSLNSIGLTSLWIQGRGASPRSSGCVLAVSRDRSRALWRQADGPFYISSPTFDDLEEVAELDAFDASSFSPSPAGPRLAFVAPLTDVILDQGPGWILHPYEVFIMDLRTGAIVQLTDEAAREDQVFRVEWAPDGSRLLVETNGHPERVFTIQPDGAERTPKNLPEASFPNPTWSPDGGWIAYFFPEAVRVAADDRGTSQVLVDLRDGGPCYGNTYGLAWSPDGEELAFSIHYPDTPDIEQNDAEIFVVEVRTGAVRRLPKNASREDVLLWLPPPR